MFETTQCVEEGLTLPLFGGVLEDGAGSAKQADDDAVPDGAVEQDSKPEDGQGSSSIAVHALVSPPGDCITVNACGNKQSKRGVHMKGMPEKQAHARTCAAAWRDIEKESKKAWEDRIRIDAVLDATYSPQMRAAASSNKSKGQCLLRYLQMSAVDELITPRPFGNNPLTDGWCGWMGFTVNQTRSQEFVDGLFGMIPQDSKNKLACIKGMFKVANMMPLRWKWEEAFNGHVAFIFVPQK
jgi:hypothetical protein